MDALGDSLANAFHNNLLEAMKQDALDSLELETKIPTDDNQYPRFPEVDLKDLNMSHERTMLHDWYTILWVKSGHQGPICYNDIDESPDLFYDSLDLLGIKICNPNLMGRNSVGDLVAHFATRFGAQGQVFSFLAPQDSMLEDQQMCNSANGTNNGQDIDLNKQFDKDKVENHHHKHEDNDNNNENGNHHHEDEDNANDNENYHHEYEHQNRSNEQCDEHEDQYEDADSLFGGKGDDGDDGDDKGGNAEEWGGIRNKSGDHVDTEGDIHMEGACVEEVEACRTGEVEIHVTDAGDHGHDENEPERAPSESLPTPMKGKNMTHTKGNRPPRNIKRNHEVMSEASSESDDTPRKKRAVTPVLSSPVNTCSRAAPVPSSSASTRSRAVPVPPSSISTRSWTAAGGRPRSTRLSAVASMRSISRMYSTSG
ncbi:hypothetical protein AAF712_012198 [Marasmius tenuissimus]|uniref:Uncharacterized protein n=1 Tax=Marasmius tenuissimus TaxID=585030 RepID=A0ABR2ZI07_9AGAR